MARPKFDDIKSYEEFQKYHWEREELRRICKERGLFFVGTDKKLNRVIESYFNGVKIPPRRNWYTNTVLNAFVNENGLMPLLDFGLTIGSVILCGIGIYLYFNVEGELYLLFLILGIIVLIIAVMFVKEDRFLAVLRSYGPICGDKKFTRAQVDEQANAKETKPLGYENILLAPDMIIGVSAGIAAVAYEDIDSLQVKRTEHFKRYRGQRYRNKDYFVYDIIIRTNKGKKVVISRSERNPDSAFQRIYEYCLTQNRQVKFHVEDQQVTHGDKVKSSVATAVRCGNLTSMTVSEDLRKRFARFHLYLASTSFLGCALISGGVIFLLSFLVTNWLTIGGVIFLLLCLSLPFGTFLNLATVISCIRKNDIDFYSCEISQRYDNGYAVKGVSSQHFGFIKKMSPDTETGPGDRVILARLEDRFSLISYDRL